MVTPPTLFKADHKGQNPDDYFKSQMKIAFEAFHKSPKTMLMVSVETGIMRASICRYVSEWRENDKIQLVKTGLCKVSNHEAGYLTTNQELFPESNQLELDYECGN